MSISHVRDSFNAAAAGKATAEKAFLSYERKHDVEYQVLRFEGSYADGSPMSFSVDCRPGTDPVVEAATAVQSLPEPVVVEKPVVVSAPVEAAPVPLPPEPPVAPVINVQCFCTCTCAPAPVQVADPGPTPEPTPTPEPEPTPVPVVDPPLLDPAIVPEKDAAPVDPAPATSEEVVP